MPYQLEGQDAWDGQPRCLEYSQPLQSPMISLAEAWQSRHSLDPLYTGTIALDFDEEDDAIQWNWSKLRTYDSKSIYKVLSEGGKVKWHYEFIWRSKATPTAKLFAYFILNDKILTKEVLRRGMSVNLHCVYCANFPIESTLHLLYLCPQVVATWYYLSILMARQIFKLSNSIHQIWEGS